MLLLSSFHASAPETAWKLVKEVDGISIYERKPPGSSISALQIKSTIKGHSLASFVALFQDLDSYDRWVYSCEKAVLLEKNLETEMLYYIRSDFPWPFDDRDFVIKNMVWQDKKTFAFHSKSSAHNNHLPAKPDAVRITNFSAEWIITPLENGTYQLLYTFHSDPGGHLPSWLVNSFIDFGPLKTVKAMEAEAKNPKYAKVKFSFINEL
jgi:hypothetical protein